jgi:hypothetical protein
MRDTRSRRVLLAGCILAVAALLLPVSPALGQGNAKQNLRFAARMAESGNWREARYRWELVRQEQSQNPRLLNNLAVASEALGEIDGARDLYERALALSPDDDRIRDNRNRFLRTLQERPAAEDQGEDGEELGDPAETPTAHPGKPTKKGNPLRVSVGIPLAPRLELDELHSVLVASFRAPESSMLDVSREIVRFLRSEFRKKADLDVRDVVPPPAIPEQTVEDLLANHEFWKHLSREYDADLIVSGVVRFGRQDVSGFEEVDVISSTTGQKVRQTQFVEQEEFGYDLDVFFMDGATGTLLFRDRFRRAVIFRGEMNDPLTAFYELSESIAGDVLAVVAPRKRVEARVVFRN